MTKKWLGIRFPWRRFSGIEVGLLIAALVCAGFTPWRAEQGPSEGQLSDPQKARLVRTLRPIAPTLANVPLWSDDLPESVRYRLELTRIFESVGVRTDAGDLHDHAVSAREVGLVIVVRDKDRPPQKSIALLRALRKGGLDASFAQDARLADRPQDFAVAVIGPVRQGGSGATETAAAPGGRAPARDATRP